MRQIKKNVVKLAPLDCLEICEEHGQLEACAMLASKMQTYLSSVINYMKLVDEKHFKYTLLL